MRLAMMTLVVRDYDEAIAWFCDRLGFALVEDTPLSADKRWVVVAPAGEDGAALLLARAKNADEEAAIGKAAGGRVAFFLHTDDFDAAFKRWRAAGVEFVETPRSEAYGKVVVFRDLYGNKWDLVERKG